MLTHTHTHTPFHKCGCCKYLLVTSAAFATIKLEPGAHFRLGTTMHILHHEVCLGEEWERFSEKHIDMIFTYNLCLPVYHIYFSLSYHVHHQVHERQHKQSSQQFMS